MEAAEAGRAEDLKYPTGVIFLVYNALCDRFAYYGIRAVLILYLTRMLVFGEDEATEIYHLFFMFCTLIPLFGASIADSFVGKFRTILVFTVVYLVGNAVLTAAAFPPLQLPRTEFSILGLALIAIGAGCVKPCVVAMGGDQFILPEQEKQLSSYFSIFYFAISGGSLVAQFLTPIFRKVSCFDDDCYSLVYGSTTIVMLTALVAFLIGKAFYKVSSNDGSIIVQVMKCMSHAAMMKYKKGKSSTELHWLDHAATSGKYDRTLVEDIKSVLKVLVLYLTFPMFWALMEQQGSRWALQATRMDGNFAGITISPDQFLVINPVLVLILIPLFDKFLYPFLAKFNILTKPLQKLAVGGLLVSVAFFISGFLELHLEAQQPAKLPISEAIESNLGRAVMLINKSPCSLNASWTGHPEIVGSNMIEENRTFIISSIQKDFSLNVMMNGEDFPCNTNHQSNFTFALGEMKKMSPYTVIELSFNESTSQIGGSSENATNIYTVANIAAESANQPKAFVSDIHMFWLLPQYTVISIAEVLFAVAGMEFSYSQAPSSMKSVMQSAWLVCIAMGNFIVAIIAKSKFFSNQSNEFFLFAVLMLGDILIFIWLASNYKPRNGFRKPSLKPYREIVSLSLRNHECKKPEIRRHTTPT